MRTRRRQPESLALAALLALCLHIAAAAIGGHLCGGLILVSHSSVCAGECCSDDGFVRGTDGTAIRPLSSPLREAPVDSQCCIRASIVMLAPPPMHLVERSASPVAPWLAPAHLSEPADGALSPSGLAHSSHSPRPPANLAVVRSSILLI